MFRYLVEASLRQRLLAMAAALLVSLYGLWTLRQMPVDVFPDLNKPTVTLMTEAFGMAPEEVETLVTFPIESAMNGMPGVTRVRSVSGIGLSIVFVEFDWGTDVHLNRQQVAERLGLVRGQLPAGIAPQMGPITSIMGEIMLVALTGDPGKVSPMELREFADWAVRPRLLTVSGVSQVIAIGGEVRQYQVTPDVLRMEDTGIALGDLERAVKNFAANTSGGFLDSGSREYLIRHIGRTTRLADLQDLVVGYRGGRPVLLRQVADVKFAPRVKRGDAGFGGRPAVILSVQKQPATDTVRLTRQVETALQELGRSLPPGMSPPEVLFRQADFIEHAVENVKEALRDGAMLVALVLFLFLLNVRTTLISLAAIPLSILVTVLVFRAMGLSINTMTLGGIAIAIGELVDDAVVGVENVFRRLRQHRESHGAPAAGGEALRIVAAATLEVRSAILYATLIVVLVFVPLFALPGIEGRLFTPLGIAYIVSILASMAVSVAVTPALCYWLLPRMRLLEKGDGWLVTRLKRWDAKVLEWSFGHGRALVATAGLAAVAAAVAVPFFPRAFLPAFNEGTFTVNVLLNPGTSLPESNRVGRLAETLLMQVPEVASAGRRTGRAELDEHAEGVHYSEIDVDVRRSERSREEIVRDMRARLSVLPAAVSIGQPISHRLDHLLSGVRAQIALKIYGDDLDLLRGLAGDLRERLAKVPGLADLQVEKQVLIPQQQVRLDYAKAASYGVTPAAVLEALETLVGGREVSQVIDGNRRFDVVLRVAEADRTQAGLASLLIETPAGRIPLSRIASIEDRDGPNQVSRDSMRRRIVISANAEGRDLSRVVEEIRAEVSRKPLPEGYFTRLEGQFQAQEEATRMIGGLAALSLAMIFVVLYSRYRSARLALLIMANVPLALVGAVIALWLSGGVLSVASLIGFVTLAGIATRNGILKVSHYINLAAFEGEPFGRGLIVRGSLERLTPVLMTALVAALGLLPLIVSGTDPGKEILHPVAVVIFGGLASSTILDTLITPVMFHLWGREPLERLVAARRGESF